MPSVIKQVLSKPICTASTVFSIVLVERQEMSPQLWWIVLWTGIGEVSSQLFLRSRLCPCAEMTTYISAQLRQDSKMAKLCKEFEDSKHGSQQWAVKNALYWCYLWVDQATEWNSTTEREDERKHLLEQKKRRPTTKPKSLMTSHSRTRPKGSKRARSSSRVTLGARFPTYSLFCGSVCCGNVSSCSGNVGSSGGGGGLQNRHPNWTNKIKRKISATVEHGWFISVDVTVSEVWPGNLLDIRNRCFAVFLRPFGLALLVYLPESACSTNIWSSSATNTKTFTTCVELKKSSNWQTWLWAKQFSKAATNTKTFTTCVELKKSSNWQTWLWAEQFSKAVLHCLRWMCQQHKRPRETRDKSSPINGNFPDLGAGFRRDHGLSVRVPLWVVLNFRQKQLDDETTSCRFRPELGLDTAAQVCHRTRDQLLALSARAVELVGSARGIHEQRSVKRRMNGKQRDLAK